MSTEQNDLAFAFETIQSIKHELVMQNNSYNSIVVKIKGK